MSTKTSLVPIEKIENRIFLVRSQKIMLDSDLAAIYRVETRVLNQAVKRNSTRFPPDFMFRLTKKEYENLISQSVTSSFEHGGRRTLPMVFTEHGAVMLASILNSHVAVSASIRVVRAFVNLRAIADAHRELADKLKQLESTSNKHDKEINILFEAIRRLMSPPSSPRQKIGFK